MFIDPSKIIDVYVIRDDVTGLFSRGGCSPIKWSRHGKAWSNIGHLKNHFYSAISTLPIGSLSWGERQTKSYKLSRLMDCYPSCSVVKLGPGESNEVTPLPLWCELNNWPTKYRGE